MKKAHNIHDFSITDAIKDSSFKLLMRKRINNVLIVCTQYDFFILEEDGRIDEQVFNEYASLGLRYPPQFIHITNEKSAIDKIISNSIDLVILIPGVDNMNFNISRNIYLI